MDKSLKRTVITSAIALVLLLAIVVGAVYAWFVNYSVSLTLVTGDVEINVQGWYGIYTELKWQEAAELPDAEKYPEPLSAKLKNEFGDGELASNDFVAFRFRVENVSERDAFLSVRFGDFSEYIFSEFMSYYNNNGRFERESDIISKAESNTAKLAYVIDKAYYRDGDDGTLMPLYGTDEPAKYLWEYAYGHRFINDLELPAGESLNVYFAFTNNLSTAAIDAYKVWLGGSNDGAGNVTVGYGQDRCANLLGYSGYAAIPDDTSKTYIDQYLAYFFEKEKESINPGEADMSMLNLEIKYFEFIGENASESGTITNIP